jgi:hypothetical protein
MQSIKKSLLFLEKVEGKEQLIRLAQYIAFFLQAVFKRTCYTSFTRKNQKLSGNLSIVRKVLRFGMPLVVLSNLASHIRIQSGKYLKILCDLLSLLFYTSDHLLYFYRVRLITLAKNTKNMQIVDIVRNLAWVLFLVAKMIDNAMDVHKVQKKIQKLSISDDLNYRNNDANERFMKLLHQSDLLMLGIISCALDVPVALYFLDPSKISPIIVGALGSFSSIVHIVTLSMSI